VSQGIARVIVVTGTRQEAATLRSPALVVIAGGGDAASLRAKLEAAVAGAVEGAAGIISFGMAGALADGLAIGDWVVGDRLTGEVERDCDPAWCDALLASLPRARAGTVYADGRMIDTVAEKRVLAARHHALAVDMESHVAAAIAGANGLPFAVARCISDGPDHALPHAITVAMRPGGGLDLQAMLRSLATRPGQAADIARTTAGFAKAMRELKRGAARIGSRMALD
jgi:adenosylhomocysteine nucleosidase